MFAIIIIFFRSVAIYAKTLDNSRPITAAIATNVDTDELVSGSTIAGGRSGSKCGGMPDLY